MRPDPRFFAAREPVSLAELVSLTGASPLPPGLGTIGLDHVGILSHVTEGGVTFVSDKRYLTDLASTRAAACFLPRSLSEHVPAGCVGLLVNNPQAAYALTAERLYQPVQHEGSAAISEHASLETDITIGPGVVIGQGAFIGSGTVLGANAVIGPGVAIGRSCQIGPGAVVGFALVGDRVRLDANVVIGNAGFGATLGPAGIIDIPQLGRVIIQDGVTVGANSTVDRGAYDDTVIGENTKIDNLVHIAHGVRIGRNSVLAAQAGIAGSTIVGDGVRIAGHAGVADHLTIGSGAQIGGAAGVTRDIPKGEVWSGYPAQPLRQWLRESAWLKRAASSRRPGGVND